MSEALNDFLIDLAVNPDRLAQFMRDPHAEIERAQLTVEEADAVLARDRIRIRAVMGLARVTDIEDVEDISPARRKGGKKKPAPRKPAKKKAPRRPSRKKK